MIMLNRMMQKMVSWMNEDEIARFAIIYACISSTKDIYKYDLFTTAVCSFSFFLY